MRSTKTYLALGMMLLLAPCASAHERVWPGKRLASLWPEAARFTSKQVNLNTAQIAHLEEEGFTMGAEDKSPVFYFANGAGTGKSSRILGIILFVDEYGDNGRMEISVGLTSAGTVEKLDIWEHSEDKRVATADFLKQFIGKTHAAAFVAGQDYKPVEGARKASSAVALAVKKALSITDVVFGHQEIKKTPKDANSSGKTPGAAGGEARERKPGGKHE